MERDSVSPYNENSTNNSKTIPKRKVSVVNRNTCVNHGEVEAEFKI